MQFFLTWCMVSCLHLIQYIFSTKIFRLKKDSFFFGVWIWSGIIGSSLSSIFSIFFLKRLNFLPGLRVFSSILIFLFRLSISVLEACCFIKSVSFSVMYCS